MTSLDRIASYVIVQRRTGDVLCETFDVEWALRLNRETYDVVPIAEYLGNLNRTIRETNKCALQ